jgi:hypothetical protein
VNFIDFFKAPKPGFGLAKTPEISKPEKARKSKEKVKSFDFFSRIRQLWLLGDTVKFTISIGVENFAAVACMTSKGASNVMSLASSFDV